MTEREERKARIELTRSREEHTFHELWRIATGANGGGVIACLGFIGAHIARSSNGTYPGAMFTAFCLFIVGLLLAVMALATRGAAENQDVRRLSGQEPGWYARRFESKIVYRIFTMASGFIFMVGLIVATIFLRSRAT